MKNALRLFTLICCSLFLFGCPYDSRVPISPPTTPPDKNYVGVWTDKERKEEYGVRIDGNEYKIEKKEVKSGNTVNYRGFISDVNGQKFLNVYENGAEEISYSLYKIEKTENGIILKAVSEKIKDKFSSSAELRAFVEKNMGSSSFYNAEEVFTLDRKFTKRK